MSTNRNHIHIHIRIIHSDQFLESSGTEGDSSQQSVVYLHATTIGNIPQPYVASSRRSVGTRTDDSASQSTLAKAKKPLQPMVRTTSNSVSLTAPWSPRHGNGEYVINYNQWTPNRMVQIGLSDHALDPTPFAQVLCVFVLPSVLLFVCRKTRQTATSEMSHGGPSLC